MDYFFTAARRGKDATKRDVIIKGQTLGPPGAEPFLLPGRVRDPYVRTFQVAFRNNNARRPWVTHPIEHREPDVPGEVIRPEIILPTDDLFAIDSQNPAVTRMTSQGEELRFVGEIQRNEVVVQLENLTMPAGVLDAIGKEMVELGCRGTFYIGRNSRTRQMYFAHRKILKRPCVMEVNQFDISTVTFARATAARFCSQWRMRGQVAAYVNGDR